MDWKKLVGTVAPTLATALGGPLAGMATKAIAAAVLGNENATEREIQTALTNATPETLLALKRADQEFAVKMKELDIDLEKVYSADRDSARNREIQTKDSWTPRILAAVVISGFFYSVWMVLGYQSDAFKDPLTATLAGTLIGYVSAKADTIIAYYFGSSASSARKTDLIEKMEAVAKPK